MVGLKENVIIGKLIPAGAGLSAYRDMASAVVPDPEPPEEPELPAEQAEPEESDTSPMAEDAGVPAEEQPEPEEGDGTADQQ